MLVLRPGWADLDSGVLVISLHQLWLWSRGRVRTYTSQDNSHCSSWTSRAQKGPFFRVVQRAAGNTGKSFSTRFSEWSAQTPATKCVQVLLCALANKMDTAGCPSIWLNSQIVYLEKAFYLILKVHPLRLQTLGKSPRYFLPKLLTDWLKTSSAQLIC